MRTLLRVFADSARSGYCRGCGRAVVWFETVNRRTLPMNVDAVASTRDYSHRHQRFVWGFLRSASHWATCADSGPFRTRYTPRRRSRPEQLALPVD